MPYVVRKDNNKYCVFNTDTNENKGCSATQAEADAHLKALYAAEPKLSVESDVNEPKLSSDIEDAMFHLKLALDLHGDEEELSVHLQEALAALNGYEMTLPGDNTPDDEPDFTDNLEEFPWEGPVVFENVYTGDNRIFKTDSIIWEPDTLPWAFRWQKHSEQGHSGAVPVGRVDDMKRMDDGSVHGEGVIIPGLSDEATEYYKLLKSGVGGGVSVDGDSAQFDIVEMTDGKPPKYEFSSMRLRALSAVDVPAFINAKIHLVDNSPVEVVIVDDTTESTLMGPSILGLQSDEGISFETLSVDDIIIENFESLQLVDQIVLASTLALDEGEFFSFLDTIEDMEVIEEFFNKCHGSGGKFCGGAGGGTRSSRTPNPSGYAKQRIEKIRAVRAGRKSSSNVKNLTTGIARRLTATSQGYGSVKLKKLAAADITKFSNSDLKTLNTALKDNMRHSNFIRTLSLINLSPIGVGYSTYRLKRIPTQITRINKELKSRNVALEIDGVIELGDLKNFAIELGFDLEVFATGDNLPSLVEEIAAAKKGINDGTIKASTKKLTPSQLKELEAYLSNIEADEDVTPAIASTLKSLVKEPAVTAGAELLHGLEEIQDVITDIELGEIVEEVNTYFRTKETIGWRFDSLIASAVPTTPSTVAFMEPEFDGPTPLTVTKDGRVFGHLALFNTCHIGFPGTCVKPPKGSKYQYFHTGEIETIEGDLVEVGHLTFNVGHAPMNVSPKQAADHYKISQYDNVQTVAADVRAGEDKFGIWVVGALRSTLSEEDIRAFRSAPLSGDWRRIAGRLELVGALAVNVPGFPVPRVRALVASGETETLFTFLEGDDEEFYSDYELKLRANKKASLAQRVGLGNNVVEASDTLEDHFNDYEEVVLDYEQVLRYSKKDSLALRIHDKIELAQNIEDFLAEPRTDPNVTPSADNLPTELPDLPKNPTKSDFEKLAKNLTQNQLLHYLKDLRDLLDDPNEKISVKDRKNLELLYTTFITTKDGKKVTVSGMETITMAGVDIEEFYNKCHGPGGKFCGGGGSGGGSGKGVTGKHYVPNAKPGDPSHSSDPGHAAKEHNKSGSGGGGGGGGGGGHSKGGKPQSGKPQGNPRDAADRTSALTQLQNYQEHKHYASVWTTTAVLATAAQIASRAGPLLPHLVAPLSPLLANPAVLTALGGLAAYKVVSHLNAARQNRRDFTRTISKINKRAKIDTVIKHQREKQNKIV